MRATRVVYRMECMLMNIINIDLFLSLSLSLSLSLFLSLSLTHTHMHTLSCHDPLYALERETVSYTAYTAPRSVIMTHCKY